MPLILLVLNLIGGEVVSSGDDWKLYVFREDSVPTPGLSIASLATPFSIVIDREGRVLLRAYES